MRSILSIIAVSIAFSLPSKSTGQYQAHMLQGPDPYTLANGASGGGVAGMLRVRYLIPDTRNGGFISVFDYRAGWWPHWSEEAVILDGVEGTFSVATSISGTIVGGVRNNRAVYWPTGTPNDYIDLQPAFAFDSFVKAVDATSQGGWMSAAASVRPVVWFGTAASAVDLFPPGMTAGSDNGEVTGTAPGVQVGRMWTGRGGQRAYMWNGTAASGVDRTPAGVIGAAFLGTDGGQHAGYVVITGEERERAAIWSADGTSWTNIHPAGKYQSLAYACRGGKQVGLASTVEGGYQPHAWLWSGTAESSVDLHQFLPAEFVQSYATGIDEDGVISGYATTTGGGDFRAVVWVPAQTNNAPTADAGVDQTATYTGATTIVSLDGTASSDPDAGETLTYEWSEGATVIGTDATLDASFSAGVHDVTLTVTDGAGAMAIDTVKISVGYSWSGVLAPLNADGSSVFKLGSTVPIKFTLTGASAPAGDIGARLYLSKLSDMVFGTEVEAVSTIGADSGNTFRFSDDKFIFNLSTKPLSVGTWRLRIDLGDGATHTVQFSLK